MTKKRVIEAWAITDSDGQVIAATHDTIIVLKNCLPKLFEGAEVTRAEIHILPSEPSLSKKE